MPEGVTCVRSFPRVTDTEIQWCRPTTVTLKRASTAGILGYAGRLLHFKHGTADTVKAVVLVSQLFGLTATAEEEIICEEAHINLLAFLLGILLLILHDAAGWLRSHRSSGW